MSRKKIKFWVMPNAGFGTRKILEQELEYFKKQIPNLTIEVSIVSWSKVWQKLIQSFKCFNSDQDVPDVVQIGHTWQGVLSYLGQLTDLSSFLSSSFSEGGIPFLFPSKVSINSKKIYSVPWFSDIRVLYYRKDILKKFGVSPHLCQTWEGFSDVLKFLKQKLNFSMSLLSLSGHSGEIPIHDFAPWVWSAGGDFFSKDLKQSTLSSEKTQNAIHFYLSWIQNGWTHLLENNLQNCGNFFSGQSVFQVSGKGVRPSLLNSHSFLSSSEILKVMGVRLLPSVTASQPSVSFVGGSHLAILSSSKNVEDSWKLIQFLTQRENHKRYVECVGALPVYTDCFNEEFFKQDWDEFGSIFAQTLSTARGLESIPLLGTVEQLIRYFSRNLLKCVLQKKYDLKILDELSKKTDVQIETALSLYA